MNAVAKGIAAHMAIELSRARRTLTRARVDYNASKSSLDLARSMWKLAEKAYPEAISHWKSQHGYWLAQCKINKGKLRDAAVATKLALANTPSSIQRQLKELSHE